MSSHFYVSGPADIAVGTGASKALQFLGWTRDGAHIREDVLKRPVNADYAGPEMAADWIMIGKLLTISCRLVRFDPAVMAALMARYFTSVAGGIEANGIGTLLYAEGAAFPVLVRSRYQAAKAIFANNLPGINAPRCVLDQGHEYNMSTVEQEHSIVFTSSTLIDPTTLAGGLWTTDMSAFPQVS